MAQVFWKLTTRGKIGSEAVQNIFYYTADLIAVTDPTSAQMLECAQAWHDNLRTPYLDTMPSDYTLNDLLVTAFKDTGEPGNALPVVLSINQAGNRGTTRDGNSNYGVLNASVGDLVIVTAGAGQIRRPYWAQGPLLSSDINDIGDFTTRAAAPWNSWAALMDDEIFVTAGIHFEPVKVSHTLNHEPVPSLTSYRPVTGAVFGVRAKTRRSRNNQR